MMKEFVQEALDNAFSNGIDFTDWTDEEVACDMITYDFNLEDCPFETVLYWVKELRI